MNIEFEKQPLLSFAGEVSLQGNWQSFQSSSPELFHFLMEYKNKSYLKWPGIDFKDYFKQTLETHQSVVFPINEASTPLKKEFMLHLFPGNQCLHMSCVEIKSKKYFHPQMAANTDRVTGMKSKSLFFPQLDTHIKLTQRYNHPLSILIIRIKELKDNPEKFNRESKKQVIQKTAEILRLESRDSDLLFRINESDFNIILPFTDKKGAEIRKKSFSQIFINNFADIEFNVILGCGYYIPEEALNTDDMDLSQRVLQDALNDLEYGT